MLNYYSIFKKFHFFFEKTKLQQLLGYNTLANKGVFAYFNKIIRKNKKDKEDRIAREEKERKKNKPVNVKFTRPKPKK